ncbi:glutathione peroxidase [Oceanibium sediminis]|uniref:glutathione peroxidase n=1 Tax=Oceanibium sediminis TaxID=2026339 RepID=UPI00351A5954
MTRRFALALPLLALSLPALAAAPEFTFPSIDGGTIDLAALRGKPVLVVNTASQCAYTPQYDALQALHESYAGRATVLAVPSDDFGGQELDDAAAVKEFCEVNFALTLPMTDIQVVRGAGAHPFYAWAAEQGVTPSWNFHKILLDSEGRIVAEFNSNVRPDSAQVLRAIDAAL